MLVYIKPLSMFPKLHSDTLFGALTSAINELFPDKIDEMISEFKNSNPPFLISSTFPFIDINGDKKRFLPKIILNTDFGEVKNVNLIKEYKKVDYLEEEIFLDIINGKLSEVDILNNFDNYHKLGNLLMKKDYDMEIISKKNILPNNSVNRLTNETEAIFYSEGLEFGNLALFFFVEILNDEYDNIIKSAIKFLKDRGFGKDISTGKGQFDYELEDIALNNLHGNTGDKFITLSRFIPTGDDLGKIIADANYEIGSKRGRDKSGEIRKQVRFFKEGSTFRNSKEIYGQIVDSGKIASAIEYGYAFALKYNEGV
ncbi:type III-A CRISPR-associated RAMP protein Csm4 [Methanobrevibacter oralis]|uniref:CRISPR system Cms protein Csm4 n=1 Tax=Methanobrevibacter oralis TaxID=66851 RepID=A0A166AJ16_METOA|nr:type III-A CRISPR-associated RAMP protein Csm4 [Methanobrevibacter oralis]KZX12089.1 hypothetical protein MBORA_13180 [Methanobrevibacter oralis]